MTSVHVAGVLDLTFLDIAEEADLAAGLIEREKQAKKMEASLGKTSSKEDIKAIRLTNNKIYDVNILLNPTNWDPKKILWLDMSFNSVEKLTEEFFVVYANVTTIHLHANQFMKLSDIKRIGAGFPNLRSLSLYGNEVADNKHYRNMVLHCCPKLVQFDFSPVTASERNKMTVWEQTYRKKLHPEDD